MRVHIAHPDDIPGWLQLAAEVEPLFGPMAHDPVFYRALRKNIERSTAFCVREGDGPPGSPLMGGLLFSPHPPHYVIGWLAVAERWRGHGVGHRLIDHALDLVQIPADIAVTTFAEGIQGGETARRLYHRIGLRPAESGPTNPAGIPTQVYRCNLSRTPTVRAVMQHEDRYLLVQHDNHLPETIGKWGLPGGRVDPTDTDRESALRRELREEFQVEVEVIGFLHTYIYRERLHHIFHVRPVSMDLVFDPNEILGHTWLTYEEIEAWETAGKLHTGFEYPAITASRKTLP